MTGASHRALAIAGVIATAAAIAVVAVWQPTRNGQPEPATPRAAINPSTPEPGDAAHQPAERARRDDEPVLPEVDTPTHPAPLDAAAVTAADDTAVAFALAYATRRWDETSLQRGARLAPLLTDHARALLAGGSSAAAETQEQQRRRERATAQLASSEPVDVTPQAASFLVVVQVTITEDRGSETLQRAYKVTVVPTGQEWLVDDFAPAQPGSL